MFKHTYVLVEWMVKFSRQEKFIISRYLGMCRDYSLYSDYVGTLPETLFNSKICTDLLSNFLVKDTIVKYNLYLHTSHVCKLK